MKRHRFIAPVAFGVLVLLGLAALGPAGEELPFKGTLEGSYTATPVNPDFPLILNVQLDAAGNATHLGAFTYDFPHVVDRSTRPSTGVGSSTFTAANGDKVFADVTGEATLVAPGLLNVVENGTITGGTGRFVGASGNFVIHRQNNQITLTTTGSFGGTISSVGAGNP